MSYPRTKEEWLALFAAVKSGDPAAAIAFSEALAAFRADLSNRTADTDAYVEAVAEWSPAGKRAVADGTRHLLKDALGTIAEGLNDPDRRHDALQRLAALGVAEDRFPELLKLSNDEIWVLLQAQRIGGKN